MNNLEIQMVESLKELKGKYGAVSVKAEFEAEGTRLEELLRLKEICMSAGVKVALKIGGCESLRDILESKVVGVDVLVAPMVETAYALRKYLQAVAKVFSAEEIKDLAILTNIETATAIENFKAMLAIPEIHLLKGIVIERYDLFSSMGRGEDYLDSKELNEIVGSVCSLAKKMNLACYVGGGVSAQHISLFKTIECLDFYETRKVCFDARAAFKTDAEKGILKALGFELLWIKNKLNFNNGIQATDVARMNTLEQSYRKAIDELI